MNDFVTIFYWVRLAALIVLVLLALVMAYRMSRRRRYGPARDISFAVGAIAAFGGIVYFTDPSFSVIWAAGLGVVGAVAGYFAGRLSRFWTGEGRIYVRRAPIAPWLWALSAILVMMTLLFGTSYLFALAMLLQAFAMGVVVGQVAAEILRVRSGRARQKAGAGDEAAVEAPAAGAV